MADAPLLQIEDLTVSFAARDGQMLRAVHGVSMTVRAGKTLAVVGESGSGKSVTALTILRLLPPTATIERGNILFQGKDLFDLSERHMLDVRGGEIAMIFQEPMTSLNPVFPIGDQVAEAVRRHHKVTAQDAKSITIEAMNAVRLPQPAKRYGTYPHQLSGGMRQRVMIAMALACKPKLLLADEPTTALDVTIQADILALLRRLRDERNMGVLLITHDLGIVADHADEVCVMYAGAVVERASVCELLANPLHPYTRGLLACRPRMEGDRARLRTIAELVASPSEFRAIVPGDDSTIPWWPSQGGPARSAPQLQEVHSGHWVACRPLLR
ncbi:MAG TPA: ABC transporter ATP-binding protein [Phycisphaerales bacterium]|nr:ABC transporter ATP-binding protein [Phycisphaerales bacterium]HRQ75216.1 ABC transporter ATP-binding protein [Phycisphaerales bacterium]